jgi:hypothetical protein
MAKIDLNKSRTKRTSRINEQTAIEKQAIAEHNKEVDVVNDHMDYSNYDIPVLKSENRGKKSKNPYEGEIPKRVSFDLPLSVFKAFSNYCTDEDLVKKELLPEMIIKLLKSKKRL